MTATENALGGSAGTFYSLYSQGFARVAVCRIAIHLSAPDRNATAVLQMARQCHEKGVALAVFTELTLSGYSIEDLLLQDALLDAVGHAIDRIGRESMDFDTVLVVGAPLRHLDRIYNTAIVLHRGRILGVVPKSYLPNYREFYERRQVAAGEGVRGEIDIGQFRVPFGNDLLFAAADLPGFVLHVEICEDFWIPIPPSAVGALAGATILANLSGSPITIGRADTRRRLAQSASARCLAAYLYAAAGTGESTTDVAWDGQLMIFENGIRLAEGEHFKSGEQTIISDIDLDLLRQERMRMGTFDDNRRAHESRIDAFRRIQFDLVPPRTNIGLLRDVERFPFVPNEVARLDQDCYEAYSIQVAALAQRLRATKIQRVVIGISGGLDSTQALIVAARALDQLGLPRSNILAFTMPGFATGGKSKGMAAELMRRLGTTGRELDIRPVATQMLRDLDHPFARGEPAYDVTFENVQAGLRTDYLFRLANQHQAIVIGTSDLSELALGWCTYGVGDHMSHYAVNSGVPKTLIQHLIRWVIRSGQFASEINDALDAILDGEISPELVPARDGATQSTESLIGPYALHDFFLFYMVRYGLRPSKVAFLAWHAWADISRGAWPTNFPDDRRKAFQIGEIRHWLEVFLQRFFGSSQFKRSAIPNGPKISAGGALSPRGDWRAPSDGNAGTWVDELRRQVPGA
jgi:NAD+ synthase (glutamine-hydrolysing)